MSPPRSNRHAHLVAAAVAMALFAVLVLLGAGGAPPANAAPPSEPVCTVTQSRILINGTGLVVALPAPYDTNGTRPIMWSYWGGNNQRWCETGTSGGSQWRNRLSGKCLTASGPVANGTLVDQQQCVSGNTKQRWTRVPLSSGWGLKNDGTGRCLDIVEKSTSAGAKLQVWGCSYATNQRWGIGEAY